MFLHHLEGCYVSAAHFPKVMSYWSPLIRQMCLLMNMQTQHQECSEHHNVFYTAGFLISVFWGFLKWLSSQSQSKWINLYSMQHPRNQFGDLKFLQNATTALKPCFLPALLARSLLQRRHNSEPYCKGLGNLVPLSHPAWKSLQNTQNQSVTLFHF